MMKLTTLPPSFNRTLLALCFLVCSLLAPRAEATVAYTQPPNPAGGQYKSAWFPPDGLDGDTYIWDGFVIPVNTAVTEVRWRGAYTNYLSNAGTSPVFNFRVRIYPSSVGGSQPDITAPPLVSYNTNNNAGETPAGTYGGVHMYDYAFILPSPFQAAGGTKYWIQIVASQGVTPTYGWPPDWSLAAATGGDGYHVRKITGSNYTAPSGDCAFTLLSSDAPTFTITASAVPAEGGTLQGAGAYPSGSTATLKAFANPGFGFVNWTQNGAQVSTNPNYSFTVTANRTLAANFVAAYTITTTSFPTYGGTTSGGGTFNTGSSVTVTATAAQGFHFSQWTEYGTPVSTSATYTFAAAADQALTAVFVNNPLSVSFDFDNAPPYTSLPISVSSGGLTAHLSATDGGYSIQAVGAVGITPAGFSGRCVYPNSVFPADFIVDFTAPLTDFSILYALQELACDTSARVRVTTYLNGAFVATATKTATVPGTYPSDTLSIAVPANSTGFNRAVVHYDAAPPPGCTDYGVILFLDNMVVTQVCTPPVIHDQPAAAASCPSDGAAFWVAAAGAGTFNYQWQRETTPETFVDLADGTTSTWDGGAPGVGGIISGANSETLVVNADTAAGTVLSTAHAVRYRCVVSNACGMSSSEAAGLTICPPDVNCDGVVDSGDYLAFLLAFAGGEMIADRDGSGQIDSGDYLAFLLEFASGC